MDHATTTIFFKTKVAKVDLTTSVERVWLDRHAQQFMQLPLKYLGELIELTSAYQALNPLWT